MKKPPPSGLTKGDVLHESRHGNDRHRTVFLRYNSNSPKGYDIQRQQLRICALCPAQEWVPELSRSTRWTKSRLSQLLPNTHYCPAHRCEGSLLDDTLRDTLRHNAQDIILKVRERTPNPNQ